MTSERRVAILTCMDARIDPNAALGLELGTAFIIRNAGARVTDDVVRSVTLAVHVLGVDELLVMHHTDCRLEGVSESELKDITGADLTFFTIDDHETVLRQDVEHLTSLPFLENLTSINGLIYDVASGKVDDVVQWRR